MFCIEVFWYLLGVARECERCFVWLEELVWKIFIGYLEPGSTLVDVDSLARMEWENI